MFKKYRKHTITYIHIIFSVFFSEKNRRSAQVLGGLAAIVELGRSMAQLMRCIDVHIVLTSSHHQIFVIIWLGQVSHSLKSPWRHFILDTSYTVYILILQLSSTHALAYFLNLNVFVNLRFNLSSSIGAARHYRQRSTWLRRFTVRILWVRRRRTVQNSSQHFKRFWNMFKPPPNIEGDSAFLCKLN